LKIAGKYPLDVPQERAYALLQDPDVLARCMPGCDALVKTGDGEYQMRMKLMLASMSGLFEGKIYLTDQNPPDSFRMRVEGKGKVGFMNGTGLVTLTPGEVNYDGDVNIGGAIAAVGQRLIDTTSKMMIKRFFDKLSEIARSEAAS
jgi:carbon monoxide dehydrogenase subunit G